MLSQKSPRFKSGDVVYWRNRITNYIMIAKIISVTDSLYYYEIIHPMNEDIYYAGFSLFETDELTPSLITEEIKLELL